MINLDIFGTSNPVRNPNKYSPLGYPFNPFREYDERDSDKLPLYKDHISSQLQEINDWINDVVSHRSSEALTLVGSVGTGKTTLLRFIESSLAKQSDLHIGVERSFLSDTGYGRASLGGILVASIERCQLSWLNETPPEGIIPIIWAIVRAAEFPSVVHSPLAQALQIAQKAGSSEKRELAKICTKWIQRVPLTANEANRTGLHRRIDWEGETIRYVAELIRIAKATGQLTAFFLLLDQLEDLFRPTFTELRRSRILTDLRGLIDEIDAGTPIALLIAWTSDFNLNQGPTSESQMRRSYQALFTRLERRMVRLPLLKQSDLAPFAAVLIEALPRDSDWDKNKHPGVEDLAKGAWERLYRMKQLSVGTQQTVTPRAARAALADEVDDLAEKRSSRQFLG